MLTRSKTELAAIILGLLFLVVGALQIIFPMPGLVLHFDEYLGGYLPESVTKEGSRVYGFIGVILGTGLLWLARCPRFGAKRSATEDYVWKLSQELVRRFGARPHYTIEEVNRVARESRLNVAFIEYAHAMFCSRADFDACYKGVHAPRSYDQLRAVISRRYFDGAFGFDAATVVRFARPNQTDTDHQHWIHDTGGG